MNQAVAPSSNVTRQLQSNIAACFSRAAKHYDEHAVVQQQVAADAMACYQWHNRDIVLDLGAGTGNNTQAISTHVAQAVGLDLSPGMVAEARSRYPQLTFIEGDAQALPFVDEQFSVVFSSMALQWCACPSRVLHEIHRVLKPGGTAVLAVMVDGSFTELQAARRCAGLSNSLMPLPGSDTWLFHSNASALTVTSQRKQQYTGEFDNVLALLRSITRVGAGFTTNAGPPLRRCDLQRLTSAYQQSLTASKTYPLSYQILHLTLEKP